MVEKKTQILNGSIFKNLFLFTIPIILTGVLQLFYNIIPYPYWYMLFCIIVVALYLGLVYIKEIIALVKKRKTI